MECVEEAQSLLGSERWGADNIWIIKSVVQGGVVDLELLWAYQADIQESWVWTSPGDWWIVL